MTLTDTLCRIAGRQTRNLASLALGVQAFPDSLTAPHRLAHFVAQAMQESGGGVYDREIWGPTPAQSGYEGRADLGNIRPGDGYLFRGVGPFQITGRANVTRFWRWCGTLAGMPTVPDFTADPGQILTDPWEGLSAVWFWHFGTGMDLGTLADANNIEMITRRINGGLNGFDQRLAWYAKAALVLLGYAPDDVRGFQRDQGFTVGNQDGIAGPMTRTAMHAALVKLAPLTFPAPTFAPAPVVDQKPAQSDPQPGTFIPAPAAPVAPVMAKAPPAQNLINLLLALLHDLATALTKRTAR